MVTAAGTSSKTTYIHGVPALYGVQPLYTLYHIPKGNTTKTAKAKFEQKILICGIDNHNCMCYSLGDETTTIVCAQSSSEKPIPKARRAATSKDKFSRFPCSYFWYCVSPIPHKMAACFCVNPFSSLFCFRYSPKVKTIHRPKI